MGTQHSADVTVETQSNSLKFHLFFKRMLNAYSNQHNNNQTYQKYTRDSGTPQQQQQHNYQQNQQIKNFQTQQTNQPSTQPSQQLQQYHIDPYTGQYMAGQAPLPKSVAIQPKNDKQSKTYYQMFKSGVLGINVIKQSIYYLIIAE